MAGVSPSPDSQKQATKANGYSRRPRWQKIALYVLVGGAAYYIVYMVFFAGKATGGYGS